MTRNETKQDRTQNTEDNDYKFRTTPEALDKVLHPEIDIPENATHVQVHKYNAYMMDRNIELSRIKLYSTEEEIQDDFETFKQECKEAEEKNTKPSIKQVQYNIEGLEHSFKVPSSYADREKEYDFEQIYTENVVHKNYPTVKIIFDNGAMMRIRMREDKELPEIPVEEVFEPKDPHSVYEESELNGFAYDHCETDAEKVVFAAQTNIDEYQKKYRKTEEDFNDWKPVQHAFFREAQ